MPSDRAIARPVEPAVVDRAANRLVQIADQAAIEGEPGEDRQIALRDAEGQVDLPGIAPFGDDLAVVQHETVGSAARPYRPERLVPRRFLAEIAFNDLREIAAPWGFVLGGIRGRSSELDRIEAGHFRSRPVPIGRMLWWKVRHHLVS